MIFMFGKPPSADRATMTPNAFANSMATLRLRRQATVIGVSISTAPLVWLMICSTTAKKSL